MSQESEAILVNKLTEKFVSTMFTSNLKTQECVKQQFEVIKELNNRVVELENKLRQTQKVGNNASKSCSNKDECEALVTSPNDVNHGQGSTVAIVQPSGCVKHSAESLNISTDEVPEQSICTCPENNLLSKDIVVKVPEPSPALETSQVKEIDDQMNIEVEAVKGEQLVVQPSNESQESPASEDIVALVPEPSHALETSQVKEIGDQMNIEVEAEKGDQLAVQSSSESQESPAADVQDILPQLCSSAENLAIEESKVQCDEIAATDAEEICDNETITKSITGGEVYQKEVDDTPMNNNVETFSDNQNIATSFIDPILVLENIHSGNNPPDQLSNEVAISSADINSEIRVLEAEIRNAFTNDETNFNMESFGNFEAEDMSQAFGNFTAEFTKHLMASIQPMLEEVKKCNS